MQSLVVQSILRKRKILKIVFYIHILGCGLEENTCIVSLDSEYLGSGNVDQFDAVVFRIRHFSYNAVSIFFNIWTFLRVLSIIIFWKIISRLPNELFHIKEINFKDMF